MFLWHANCDATLLSKLSELDVDLKKYFTPKSPEKNMKIAQDHPKNGIFVQQV